MNNNECFSETQNDLHQLQLQTTTSKWKHGGKSEQSEEASSTNTAPTKNNNKNNRTTANDVQYCTLTRVSFLSTDFYGHSNGDRRRCGLRARLIFQRKKDIKDLQVHTKDPKDRARGTGWFFNVQLRTL